MLNNSINYISNIINEEINKFIYRDLNKFNIDNDFNLFYDNKKIYASDSKKDLIHYLKLNIPDLLNKFNLSSDNTSNPTTPLSDSNYITLYRGKGYNEGNNYYSPSKNFALEFTKSGNENELIKTNVNINQIYKHNPLPKGYGPDDPNFNIAINIAKNMGLNAIWVDEGDNLPNSVFKINPNKPF